MVGTLIRSFVRAVGNGLGRMFLRRFLPAIVCFAAVAAAPMPAMAATPYQGSINSAYCSIFEDVVNSLSPLDHYVFYRSGENQYTLVSSDSLEFSGDFSCSDCTVHILDYISQSTSGYGYLSYYSYSVGEHSSYTVSPSGYLVYSDLAGYPDLRGGDFYALWSIFFVLVLFGLCALIRSLFVWLLRDGSR